MPDTAVQRRKGTTVAHAAFTGLLAETTFDTTLNRPVVHDGATLGGFPAAMLHLAQTFAATQTISPAVNTSALAVTGFSLTGANAQSLIDLAGTWNTSGNPAALKLSITNTASGAGSRLLDLLVGGSTKFAVDFSGSAYAAGTTFDLGLNTNASHSIKFYRPVAGGTNTVDFDAVGGSAGSWLRRYTDAPFQMELASNSGIDLVTDSNNNETGTSVRFLTNATRSGVQTLLFTVFDDGNATLVGNLTANQLLLPNTTSATVGGIYFGGNRAFHNFGTGNTAAGVNAGNFTMTGLFNSFFGVTAGVATTTGASNSFFGTYAGAANTTGSLNSFFGRSAGQANTTGLRNAFFGRSAGLANTTASDNSFFGTYAGLGNTTGTYNSFFGRSAGQTNTTGNGGSFFGYNAGKANTTGGFNAFFGFSAGLSNTTGGNNSFFGTNAGLANTTGSNSAFFGRSAGQANTTGIGNSFFGTYAGLASTTGGSNSFFGSNVGLASTTGGSNSFFGTNAGAANTTASNNSFFGRDAGVANTTGNNNTLFGFQAGNNLTTGSNNIVLGYDIDSPTATNSNTLTIGNLIFGTGVDGTGTTISTGSIGIGIITPLARLHVGGGIYMATAGALSIASGANQRAGNAVLVGGTVTVANTTVTANTIVMLTRKTSGGTIGTAITYTTIAATSFTINSDSVIDTSTFSYLLIEVP